MKKFFLAVMACTMTIVFFSCTGGETKPAASSGDDDMVKKNSAAVAAVNKAIETGDVSKLGDVITADGVDHGADPMKDIVGLDSVKASLGKIHTMADNMKMEVTKELADKDYVMQWIRVTGVAKSPEMGFKPGEKFDMNAIELSRMKDGKIAEHWEFMQMRDMMKMMASMAPPPPAAKGK